MACVLAALEQRRTVHARQEPTSQLIGRMVRPSRPVDALAGVEHHRAHDLGLAVFDLALDQLLGREECVSAELCRELLDDGLLDHRILLVAAFSSL